MSVMRVETTDASLRTIGINVHAANIRRVLTDVRSMSNLKPEELLEKHRAANPRVHVHEVPDSDDDVGDDGNGQENVAPNQRRSAGPKPAAPTAAAATAAAAVQAGYGGDGGAGLDVPQELLPILEKLNQQMAPEELAVSGNGILYTFRAGIRAGSDECSANLLAVLP